LTEFALLAKAVLRPVLLRGADLSVKLLDRAPSTRADLR